MEQEPMENGRTGRVIDIPIEDEMKSAYIDYAMSVIVSRALPDVRDGLKPVQRRVLYGMYELGLFHNRPFKKSARIVGEVLGKYHPHGDAPVYEAMVRMAQEWVMRYPLVDGQGNFGSIDGDSPAAMRYTEARLSRIAEEMLADIDKNTVDFVPNFDDSLKEPVVLPARFPNLLANGASGIAVGMATNILPHNLNELIDGIVAYIENRDITSEELMEYIKGPDFPTGGILYGIEGVRQGYLTGKGRAVVRARMTVEERKGKKQRIVVTEIPYQVSKAAIIMKIADLVAQGKLKGIDDIRDESDRSGLRIVIELKGDVPAEVLIRQLYKLTPLQQSYSIQHIALVDGKPEQLTLRDLIKHYVEHRHEVLIRKTKYELEQAERRAHILEGLLKALDHLDEIINLIRSSHTPEEAKNGLMKQFDFTEVQAKAILDMRLQKLTGLEREKLQKEYEELVEKIAFYKRVLSEEDLRYQLLKEEMLEIKKKYGDERKTEIQPFTDEGDEDELNFIPEQDVVILISHQGYVKRVPITSYRRQQRGGKGASSANVKDEDFIEHAFVANTHDILFLFGSSGVVYSIPVYKIPEMHRSARGRHITQFISLPQGEKIVAHIPIKRENLERDDLFVFFVTKQGVVKKTPFTEFKSIRSTGKKAITIKDGDSLVSAQITNGSNEIVIVSRMGQAIRFDESEVRPMGRSAAGVRGMRLEEGDEVVGMSVITDDFLKILAVSEKGYGKRSEVSDYRKTKRGGKGVKTLKITDKTGPLAVTRSVYDTDEIVIITRKGMSIRQTVKNIPVLGRNTQGVRLINLNSDDKVTSVALIRTENPVSGTLFDTTHQLNKETQQPKSEGHEENSEN